MSYRRLHQSLFDPAWSRRCLFVDYWKRGRGVLTRIGRGVCPLQLIDDLKVIAVDPQIPQLIESIAQALKERVEPVEAARLFAVAADLWKRQEDLESAQRCRGLCEAMMDVSD